MNIVRAILFGVNLCCLMKPKILFSRPSSCPLDSLGRSDLVIIEFIKTLTIKIGVYALKLRNMKNCL